MSNVKTNTKKASVKESKKDIVLSVVTAIRNGKTSVQIRWLGDARPTEEDKAKMKSCGLRFYKDVDGPCWASFKVNLEDAKALVAQMGYRLDEEKTKKQTIKESKSKAKAKKEEPKADDEFAAKLAMLASLDEEKLAKLLKIAELIG